MKTRKALTTIPILAALILLACSFGNTVITISGNQATSVRGSGNVVEATRSLKDFSRLSLKSFGDVAIELGSSPSVRVVAEDNLIQYLETVVSGRTLVIQTQRNVDINPTEPVRYYVTVESLDEVSIPGSGDIDIPTIDADTFNIHIDGSGDIEVQHVTAENLVVDIRGSGNVTVLGGEARNQEVTIAGSGNFDSKDMVSSSANLSIPGSGNMEVWVTDTLSASISGSGDVRYYGEPELSTRGAGSGNVISAGDR